MIRVVLDTNVFVSALLVPDSPPARILELALEGEVLLVLSPGIIREIGRVWQYPKIIKSLQKHRLSAEEVAAAVIKILKIAAITPGAEIASGVSPDPADDMVLSCAVEGKADFVVPGDRDLTDLEDYQGIRIVTPAAFVKLVAAS
ncbi:MAG: putative toxin-antitoxin system toxin component, PIN family [Desulfobaccales bacterium]